MLRKSAPSIRSDASISARPARTVTVKAPDLVPKDPPGLVTVTEYAFAWATGSTLIVAIRDVGTPAVLSPTTVIPAPKLTTLVETKLVPVIVTERPAVPCTAVFGTTLRTVGVRPGWALTTFEKALSFPLTSSDVTAKNHTFEASRLVKTWSVTDVPTSIVLNAWSFAAGGASPNVFGSS